MAVLRKRLEQDDTRGGFNTIYYETGSDIVLRPNGITVEDSLNTTDQSVADLRSYTDQEFDVVNNKIDECYGIHVQSGPVQPTDQIAGDIWYENLP